MNDYFKLGPPYSDETYSMYGDPAWDLSYGRAEWSIATEDSLTGIVCPVNPGHQRPGVRAGDLEIVLPSPNIGDFIWTWYGECILTERVLDLFRDAAFNGFTTRPVTIEHVKRLRRGTEAQIPPLAELVVTGVGGDADPASGIRILETCDACGWVNYSSFRDGIIVDENQWDGSDFFVVNGYPKFILVTERVKDVIVSNRLTNCVLIPCRELRWASLSRPEDLYTEQGS